MGLSLGHLLVVLIAIVILFGLGKLPNAMGDIGKGINALKKGLKESETATLEKKSEDKKEG
jgi:sec-independent protein translocase protein TatA